jgi:ABC-type multidrug transport system ATPase subunit
MYMNIATSALDTQTEQSVQDALQALGDSRTLLVIAHRLSTVRHAEQIIVLDNGRIAERGTHEELLENALNGEGAGIYANLWNLQLQHREKKGSKSNLVEALEVEIEGDLPAATATASESNQGTVEALIDITTPPKVVAQPSQ